MEFVNSNSIKCLVPQFSVNQPNLAVYTVFNNANVNCECKYSVLSTNVGTQSYTPASTTSSAVFEISLTPNTNAVIADITSIYLYDKQTLKSYQSTFDAESSPVKANFANVPLGNYWIMVKTENGYWNIGTEFGVLNSPVNNTFDTL